MPGHKIERASGDIQRELADIIRTVKDPRVSSSMVSVIKVKVSGDLSYADVYVSAIEGTDQTKIAVQGLKSAAGFIRKEIGNRLKLRKTPELRFIADDSIAYSATINSRLKELNKDKD